jgi:hypothetical protein
MHGGTMEKRGGIGKREAQFGVPRLRGSGIWLTLPRDATLRT